MRCPGVFEDQDKGSQSNAPSQKVVKVSQACADEGLSVDPRPRSKICTRNR